MPSSWWIMYHVALSAHWHRRQEVDRLDQLLPSLQGATYDHTYARGKNKKHGCLILHKERAFTKIQQRTVFYDEQHLHSQPSSRRDGSFLTNNIGLMIALQRNASAEGVIVATTHLFWHPK